MEGFKEVTSAIEGRLFVSTKKHHEAEKNNGAYFQSRPETFPMVDSWLSPFAKSIDITGNTKSISTKGSHEMVNDRPRLPHRVSVRDRGRDLPELRSRGGDSVSMTNSDAFTVALELAEPILYLEGYDFPHNSAHRSAVLRGFMHLDVSRQVSLSDVSVTFRGISRTIWPEAWRVRRLKKTCEEDIVHHSWDYLKRGPTVDDHSSRAPRIFESGQYTYAFELPLESSLPETIDLPMGKVSYTLTASAAEAGRHSNVSSFTQAIILIRIPCMCSLELTEPYEVHGLLHGLRYSFALAAKSCRVGGQLPLRIRISSPTDRSWQSINVSLVEDVQYRTRDGLVHREQSRSKAVLYTKRAKRDPLHQRALRRISAAGEKMATTYAGNVIIEKDQPRRSGSVSHLEHGDLNQMDERAILTLPSCSTIEADTAYKCLYVRHYLLITIVAEVEVNENSRKHLEIRLRMPVHVLTCKLCDGNATLPEYSENPADLALDRPEDLCRCASYTRTSMREASPGESLVSVVTSNV
ncbi:hypothetical protein LTR10_018036 [Elasticomyces elasticus]|uniref:Arrestin C-terminal-like domain-containing protein n=1 Tax=Exophiala sideris TaxID=1016849 RepID=A0ABR0JQJ7_9EURO|nr:hypothetical protein LTR10_018036 [Elasticomyces elasticus]KAK5039560.1 hypothetical protein LTS07_000054 [Exophiala sideris]KAK5041113.1 hypothetical protein LTR13_002587 [Exophiala sideris]KAK5067937.1 hypothetical protein LTR69_000054 [Exophiala sideris]KAK5187239.1 hypothetical protein LTR44_000054 [Eurotiomycetes sp. CCFEE 6388]